MGFDQFALFEETQRELQLSEAGSIKIEETEDSFWVVSDRIRYRFGKKTAGFVSLERDGKAMMDGPMRWSTWRAPTDNDRYIRKEWQDAGYDRPWTKVYSCSADAERQIARICCEFSLAGVYRQPFLSAKALWEVNAEGAVKLTLDAEKDSIFPWMPRFGLTLTLPREYRSVSYLGYGPDESYQDKHRASWIDRFETSVDSLHEDYVRPQENGSHFHCYDVQVGPLRAEGRMPFSFNASYYTEQELTEKGHNYELEKSGHVIWHLDYGMSGVGSNSCGPVLLEKYRLDEEEIHWEMILC